MRYLALEAGIGRLEDDGSVAVLDAPATLAAYMGDGRRLDELGSRRVVARSAADDVVLAPIIEPGSATWGIGLNYRSKQRATGRELPDHPTLFLKAPSAAARPHEPIAIPLSAPECVDYEGEIAVVVGDHLFRASTSEAERAVVALAAANDVTARDVMRSTGNPSLAKSFPGFAQLGSVALDPHAYGGVEALELSTTVNGEVRQHDTGAGMILAVGELLALLSHYVALCPGDVVLTGTPAGTGDETKTYLVSGDVVEVRLGDLPPLRSDVVAAEDARHRHDDERGTRPT
ncbi:MAG TPA: fumarylacetoacetate hydrolase family protein [Acidimicrobiales bacterium]|nr:fumarylacetoacetate hydrolase family protein [Acidimicrobiales bacterium]